MSALEGAIPQPLWGYKLQGEEVHGATGPSDILIVSQYETIQGEDTTPRRTTKLTSDDKRELERLDLAPDQWEDDASIMAARCSKDRRHSVTEVIKNRPGEPLMAKYVMKQIEMLMNNTQKQGGKTNFDKRY